MMRTLALILCGAILGSGAFWGAYAAIDHGRVSGRDQQRIESIKTILAAMETYRTAHGVYPSPQGDTDIFLVSKSMGVILPQDPIWAGSPKNFRYVSDGPRYAIWVHLERPPAGQTTDGGCLAGVGYEGSRWYNEPPPCPF